MKRKTILVGGGCGMPLYEYQCKDCGVRFERVQSFKDAPITVCPECEGEVHRVIGATGVIFKGSGFYVTDNRSGSGGRSSHKNTETKSDSTETKSETKTETKTEAKSESTAS